MVKKRLRTSRKQSDSDEIDSESDFGDDPPYDPTPKKYSLRQRNKRTTFTDADFQYDDEELPHELSSELPPNISPKPPSDDEDFEVEKELDLDEAPESEFIDPSTYINSIEPENTEVPLDTDELVDFEDMIRADIVVNKNRIDYDNVIQKTEIKVQPLTESERMAMSKKKTKPIKKMRKPKRRNSDMDEGHFLAPLIQEEGDEDYHPYKPKRERKQKKRADGEIDSSLLEPEMEVQEEEYEDKDDEDYNPDDDLEYPEIPFLNASLIETKSFGDVETNFQDENSYQTPVNESPVHAALTVDSTSTESSTIKAPNSPLNTNIQKTIEEMGPSECQNDDKTIEEIITTNNESNICQETVSHQDSTEKTNDILESSISVNGTVSQLENPEVHFVHKLEEEEADDDVVLIDDSKDDIIVLDD
ncbi:unnamed protein product [Phaedon cochleariae]|uniref:Uncharacterized protein n=1 Tax=Phaedon cochleariae TaxID=80249 RepID=A0A9P0GIY7_PHACE|nr:unnamed protein product [Phaedon cochleariae]